MLEMLGGSGLRRGVRGVPLPADDCPAAPLSHGPTLPPPIHLVLPFPPFHARAAILDMAQHGDQSLGASESKFVGTLLPERPGSHHPTTLWAPPYLP